MKEFILFAGLLFLCACSTVTMIHTEGEAQDVVDETQKADISPQVSVPLK